MAEDGKDGAAKGGKVQPGKKTREERLREALRANLKRRRAQGRARAGNQANGKG